MYNALIACEESQTVTVEFRKLGINAYSCDLLPTSGPCPDWHIQADVRDYLCYPWDILIAFPPCDHLAVSGARWFPEKRRDGRQKEGIDFFRLFTDLPHIPRTAIENPVGIMSGLYRLPDQYIQPWEYGHGETKKTCLWLKGLPRLEPTNIVSGREGKIWRMGPSPERKVLRSKTYQGIAQAMAQQWTKIIKGR